MQDKTDRLVIYGEIFNSRLLLGTALYPSLPIMKKAIERSGANIITLSLRRQSPEVAGGNSFWQEIQSLGLTLLPNTAGCKTAKEAISLAHMSRELFQTDWIKLEVTGDDYTLQPDPFALLEAAQSLLQEGFKVLPYCTDDLVLCQRLIDIGCEVVMPWGAPIGSGQGLLNLFALKILRERLPNTCLIIDAGIGAPSHACLAMEIGFDAILLNSAVANAADPAAMADAFKSGIEAGRAAHLAGCMPKREMAIASTPLVDMPFWHQE